MKPNTRLSTYFRGGLTQGKRTPSGFSRISMPHENAELCSKLAVSTFVEMVNHGQSFEAALTAIYLTGFENAFSAMQEKTNAKA